MWGLRCDVEGEEGGGGAARTLINCSRLPSPEQEQEREQEQNSPMLAKAL